MKKQINEPYCVSGSKMAMAYRDECDKASTSGRGDQGVEYELGIEPGS